MMKLQGCQRCIPQCPIYDDSRVTQYLKISYTPFIRTCKKTPQPHHFSAGVCTNTSLCPSFNQITTTMLDGKPYTTISLFPSPSKKAIGCSYIREGNLPTCLLFPVFTLFHSIKLDKTFKYIVSTICYKFQNMAAFLAFQTSQNMNTER